MKISRQVMSEISRRAAEASPNEACGLLIGIESAVDSLVPLKNVSPTPRTRYLASPPELFRAFQSMRGTQRFLLGIYHSHPRSEAYPSPTDVELAFYPEVSYVIASGLPAAEIRAFRIVDGQVSEVPLEIIDP